MNRREFLRYSAKMTALAMAAAGPARLVRAAQSTQPKATADNMILLWMGGGPSHMDTWDLKPDSAKN